MADITVTPSKTFAGTESVTAGKLNTLGNPGVALDAGTIVDADVSATAEIAISKLADVGDMKVLGNTSGATAAPSEVNVLDEDDMASDSETALATQQSIKAYADSRAADPERVYDSLINSTTSGNVQQNTTGRPLWVSFSLYTGDNIYHLTGEISQDNSSYTVLGRHRNFDSQSVDSPAGQVSMIVPDQWYWKFDYSYNGVLNEVVHSSFAL